MAPNSSIAKPVTGVVDTETTDDHNIAAMKIMHPSNFVPAMKEEKIGLKRINKTIDVMMNVMVLHATAHFLSAALLESNVPSA